jgi:hypothetical protein
MGVDTTIWVGLVRTSRWRGEGLGRRPRVGRRDEAPDRKTGTQYPFLNEESILYGSETGTQYRFCAAHAGTFVGLPRRANVVAATRLPRIRAIARSSAVGCNWPCGPAIVVAP